MYRRVSDEERDEGYSLENQRDRLRDWARREGYATVAEFEDNGWSGADLDRPGLDELREVVAAGSVDVVASTSATAWRGAGGCGTCARSSRSTERGWWP